MVTGLSHSWSQSKAVPKFRFGIELQIFLSNRLEVSASASPHGVIDEPVHFLPERQTVNTTVQWPGCRKATRSHTEPLSLMFPCISRTAYGPIRPSYSICVIVRRWNARRCFAEARSQNQRSHRLVLHQFTVQSVITIRNVEICFESKFVYL